MTDRIDMGVRIAGGKAKKADEFIPKSQLIEGAGITITDSAVPGADPTAPKDIKITATGGGGSVFGGLIGVNVETLSADKTLVAGTDKVIQHLSVGSASRYITLDTASATEGDLFEIKNVEIATTNYYLYIKQGTTNLDAVASGRFVSYVFDGTNWKSKSESTADAIVVYDSTVYGKNAFAGAGGTAIGRNTQAGGDGTSLGSEAISTIRGAAIGYNSDGSSYGVALGYSAKTNAKYGAVALGHQAQATRVSEISHNIIGSTANKQRKGTQHYQKITTDAMPIEMFLGGQTNQRLILSANSVLAFTGIITAREDVTDECATWEFKGSIKRDGANNTVLVGSAVIKVELLSDYPGLGVVDVNITADDTKESLKIEVTGSAANPVQFVGYLDTVETIF